MTSANWQLPESLRANARPKDSAILTMEACEHSCNATTSGLWCAITCSRLLIPHRQSSHTFHVMNWHTTVQGVQAEGMIFERAACAIVDLP